MNDRQTTRHLPPPTPAGGGPAEVAAAAVTAARAAVAEALERLTGEWAADERGGLISDDERRAILAAALGFKENVAVGLLGFGFRRAGLFVEERDDGLLAPALSWRLHHEPSGGELPHARFSTPERALAAALALLRVGADWTAADAWTGDVPTVTGLVLRPFVEEEATVAAVRADTLARALAELDAFAAWVAGSRAAPVEGEGRSGAAPAGEDPSGRGR